MAFMNLYDFFVQEIFGTFWMAVTALGFIQLIILAFGSVSGYSIMLFIGIFLLAMALGYGHMIIVIPIVIGIISWTVFQIKRYYEEQ